MPRVLLTLVRDVAASIVKACEAVEDGDLLYALAVLDAAEEHVVDVVSTLDESCEDAA
jgi:hypothetical protein